MKKHTVILWDVDGTLLDFSRSERYAVRTCLEKFGIPFTEEILTAYSRINEECWRQLELGEIDRQEVLIGRFERLFRQFSIKGIPPEEFQDSYGVALGSVYYYQDNSYELCQSLKGRVAQYIVTNGNAKTQTNKLRLAGFDRIMEDIFISEELGCPKPQKQFFEKCFARMPEGSRERCLIVGDSLTSDIRGGNNAGITACWYNPARLPNTTDARPDCEVSRLRDVLEFLE